MKNISLLLFATLISAKLFSQGEPMHQWEECLPYGSSHALANANSKIFSTNGLSLFSVEFDDYTISHYSKVNGLTDIGFSTIKYDSANDVLLIAYSNSNIDVMSADEIKNISDIKRKNIVGNKNIYPWRSNTGELRNGSCVNRHYPQKNNGYRERNQSTYE